MQRSRTKAGGGKSGSRGPRESFRVDGARLRESRKANKLTQEELAHEAGTSVYSVRRAEAGIAVSRITVEGFSDALQVPFAHLLVPESVTEGERKPIVLPYLSLRSLFKGRDQFLEELRKSLTRGPGRAAIVGSALYGLGGIGKTQAAIEYAWAHAKDYTALLFVVADTSEGLRRNLAELVGPLALDLPARNVAEEEVRLKAVLDWLKDHPGWLLILDNLDSPRDLVNAEGLLSKLTGGHVIVTSRLSDFAGHFDPLELDVLAVDDAVSFLLERTDRGRQKVPDDAVVARQLALDLGQLALALEQAGAYIAKHALPFSEYRQLWRENWEKVANWADERITRYPRSVAVTFQTSIDRVGAPGRRLLERLAWFSPEPIPKFLLKVSIPEIAPEDFGEALSDLAAYSLVQHVRQIGAFSVHRLVQEVTRRSLSTDIRSHRLHDALAWINNGFEGDPADVRTWSRLDPLEPHARAIGEAATTSAQFPYLTYRLMNQLGVLLFSKARYAEAESLYRSALAVSEKIDGPDKLETVGPIINLASLLRATNRLDDAEPLFRRGLTIAEANCGPHHPTVGDCCLNLADYLLAVNKLPEAELLYRRALAIHKKSYGPDHPQVAKGLNNLALLFQNTNRLYAAEQLFQQALALNEKIYGDNHPNVAISANNMANMLAMRGRYDAARELHRRALAIDENYYGPDHPHVARDLNFVGVLLLDRPKEAEPLFRRASAIAEKTLGSDHPDVATILSNLADTLQRSGRFAEAEAMFRRALVIDEKSYEPDHPSIATKVNNLAACLYNGGRFAEAEPCFRRMLVIFVAFSRKTGYQHPNFEQACINYRTVLMRLGHSELEAETALRTVLSRVLLARNVDDD